MNVKSFILGYTKGKANAPKPVLKSKTITGNGTYNASDDGADGYSSIIVDVPNSGGATNLYKFNDTIVSTGAMHIDEPAETYMPSNIDKLIKVKVIESGAPDEPCYMYPSALGEWLQVYAAFETTGNIFEIFKDVGSWGESINELSGITVEVISLGDYAEWFEANTTPVGGGECSGEHINIVDELPEVGVNGSLYGISTLTIVMVMNGTAMSEGQPIEAIITSSESFSSINPKEGMYCFVRDIPDLRIYAEGAWHSASEMGVGDCLGEISDISEADTSKDGYCVIVGYSLYRYTNGRYHLLIEKGDLQFTSNGDGTCYVSGLEDGHSKNISIPSTSPDGDTVTAINNYAFQSCLLGEVYLPDSVTNIGKYAFKDCTGLTSVTILKTVTSMGDGAFRGCTSLISASFQVGVTTIFNGMFYGCTALLSATLPDSVTSIGDEAFRGCTALKKTYIPDSVTNIGRYAFYDCAKLFSVTIGKGVTSVGYGAFQDCTRLSTITFKGTVEQWSAITFGEHWNENVPATKVICSDGEVLIGTLTFTIAGKTHFAENGMTWGEWIDSAYNTLGLTDNTYYIGGSNMTNLTYSGNIVLPSDTITNGGSYELKAIG